MVLCAATHSGVISASSRKFFRAVLEVLKKGVFACFISNILRNSGVICSVMLNDEQYRHQIKIPHFSSANNGPQMIIFQMSPDILPSKVPAAINLWFDSDSLLLDLTVYHCLSPPEQWMLVDKWWQKFRVSIRFQQHCRAGQLSNVKCGRFRSTRMSQHSQQSEWQNTGCHRKLEPYLTVIFRHCVKRGPYN